MSDIRDRSRWWSNFDERAMTVTLRWDEETVIPVKYEVCEVCNGKGKHVNPNIDRNGLSREDFDEDPDFAEDYFSGVYDVRCNECDGNRVAIVVDEAKATKEQQQAIWDYYAEEAADRKTRMMESGGYY